MKLFLLDASYEFSKVPRVLLTCKDEQGNTKTLSYEEFYPYFYVLPYEGKENQLLEKIKKVDFSKAKCKLVSLNIVEKKIGMQARKLIKITIDDPAKLQKARDLVKNFEEVEETYEYSINFYRRFLIDKSLSPASWFEAEVKDNKLVSFKPLQANFLPNLKLLAFDTEFVEVEGKEELIMISVYTQNKKYVITSYDWPEKQDYVVSVKSEKEIIRKFIEIIKKEDPDIIFTYNGDNFDFPKVREKAHEYGIKLSLGRNGKKVKFVRRGRVSAARIEGRVHIDIFVFVSHILAPFLKSEVLTLDEVANELLGEGKKDVSYEEMFEIWKSKQGLEKLAEYCLHDSYLTYKLGQFVLMQIMALASLTTTLPFDASRYTYSQLVEAYYMKKAYDDGMTIPNQPKQEEIMKRRLQPAYKGAIVIEPEKGIHSNIVVYDFMSLYPTIIVTHNISPETFNCEHEECKQKNKVPELNYHFCTKVQGFIPKHLYSIIKERKRIKAEMKKLSKESKEYEILYNMQYALKIIANATYGYFGYFGARWYRRECGASAAAFGRYYITKIVEMAKQQGFKVIYGDTDSIFVTKPGLSKEELEKFAISFEQKVNKTLPGIIELELRGIYKSGIFVTRQKGEKGAKKRYALLSYDGKIEIRGFETVRRDWCQLAKEIQRKVLEIILAEQNVDKALKLVKETIEKIRKREVSLKDLVIYEQLTKPISQYEQIGPHVKAAQKAMARGIPLGPGSIIPYVITKGKGSISDRAEFASFVTLEDYDPEYYINNQVVPAAARVLKALGYSEQDILSQDKQKGLTSFLK